MSNQEVSNSPLVLIADSDEDERSLWKAVFKLKGFRVLEAAHGQKAINLMTRATPDLLLIDLRLPRVSGPTVIRHVKSLARMSNLSVITFSYRAANGMRSPIAGTVAHLDKPIEFDLLLSLVERIVFPPAVAA
jgi:CheY-like chemotaxis protein